MPFDLTVGKASLPQQKNLLLFVDPWTPKLFAFGLGEGNTRDRSFPNEGSFELGKGPEELELELSDGGREIYGVLDADELNIVLLEDGH